jgi:hypothetical protein
MLDDIIMRCGIEAISLVEIDDKGIVTKAEAYPIQLSEESQENTAAWLQAFAKAVSKIQNTQGKNSPDYPPQ